MKKTADAGPHKSRTSHKEMAEYSRARQADLRRALEARKEAESAFEQAIAGSRAGKTMLAERKKLAATLAKASEKLNSGKLTRLQMNQEYSPAAEAFEKKYRPTAEKAWLEIADRAPSIYEMHRILYSDEKPPLVIEAQILYFLGLIFRNTPATSGNGTASTGQALMQPLDVSATSFNLRIEQTHTDGAGSPTTSTNAPFGGFVADAVVVSNSYVPGVASARALIGTEFTFPAGFSQFLVSADISLIVDLSTYIVLGGGGAGADLVLRVEPGAGAAAVETTLPLGSVIAPVLWGAGLSATQSLTITLSLPLTDPASQDLKVFAGASAHAEAEGSWGTSMGLATGAVSRIAVHAT
jgi:hypothetical protein